MGTIEHKTFPKGILLMQFAITLLTGILLPCNMKAQKYEGWRQNGNYGMKAEGSEEWCVPPMYEQTWGHNKAESPIFLVKRGEYYGFIDEDNNTVLPFVYTDATCFFNRLATVQNVDDSLYYAIDLKGKVVSKGYKNLSGGIGIFSAKIPTASVTCSTKPCSRATTKPTKSWCSKLCASEMPFISFSL